MTLAALVCADAAPLPTEHRIWKAGLNTDTNGYNVLFDDVAAEMVMSAYDKHGVDLIWDLEHLSLDDEHPNYDPDARASCQLEVRNGELWATNIQWTPDGAERLRNRTQRFPSAAFLQDKDGRPTRVFNIGLVSMPATDYVEPLVAKDRRTASEGPSMQDIDRAVREALEERFPRDPADPCDGPWVCEIYDETIVFEYDGKLFEAAYAFDGSIALVGDGIEVKRTYQPVAVAPAEEIEMKISMKALAAATAHVRALHKAGISPKLIIKALADGAPADSGGSIAGVDIAALAEFLAIDVDPAQDPAGFVKALMSKLDEISGKLKGDAPAPTDTPADPNAPPGDAAASKEILRICGVGSLTESISKLTEWRQLAIDDESSKRKLAEEQGKLKATRYRQMTARLVVCGAELPATAWADDAKTIPADEILAQPLERLEKRALAFEAKNGTKGSKLQPGSNTSVADISPRVAKKLADRKIDPQKYLETKAAIAARSARSAGQEG